MIEGGVKLLGTDAKTVSRAHLGLRAEDLHKEILKCVIKTNLEQNNS